MKKLLLILICFFISFEAKSEFIPLKCEVKKKIFRITNSQGRWSGNIADKSFNLITLYFDEIKLNQNTEMTLEEPNWKWSLSDNDNIYSYTFKGFYKGEFIESLYINLNKDSGYFEYRLRYKNVNDYSISEKAFYKKSYYTDGFISSGVCKKIKRSLLN